MSRPDHLSSSVHAHLPKAFAKESRSTTSCQIFAGSFSTSASMTALALLAGLPIACRFQAAIMVWSTPCLAASYTSVRSPRNASKTTPALSSPKYVSTSSLFRSAPQFQTSGTTRLRFPTHSRLHFAHNLSENSDGCALAPTRWPGPYVSWLKHQLRACQTVGIPQARPRGSTHLICRRGFSFNPMPMQLRPIGQRL